MKRIAFLTAAVLIAYGGYTSAEEEKPGPNYKHLRAMDWLIGEWATQYELPQAVPGYGKEGDIVNVTQTAEWGLRRNVIRVQARVVINGLLFAKTEGLTGWDAQKQSLVDAGFDSLGGRYTTVTTVVNHRTFKSRMREVKPSGVVRECTCIVTVDGDHVTMTWSETTLDGNKVADDPPTKLGRVK